MLKISMHEHISYQLVQFEIGSQEKMESQHVVQINSVFASHNVSEETQDINNKQIFSNCR